MTHDNGYEVAVSECAHNNYDLTELGLVDAVCLDCGAWWPGELLK